MTTAVKTQAEKDKFDREVFQFLVTPEVRQQVAGHRGTQSINFDAFAAKWNEDVGEIERNEVAGRLEVSGDANKKINRKAPFDLQNWWTESRKEANTARTVEQNKHRLSAMYEKNRVRLSEPSTAERAAVGMTITGQTFSFPLVHNGGSTVPRPAPSATGGPEHDERDERGNVSDGESLIDVGANDGVGGDTDVGDTGVGAAGTRPEDAGSSSATGTGGSSSVTTETARLRKGDGAFVVPAVACSVLHGVVPTFGTGMGKAAAAQVWHPMPPVPTPAVAAPSPRVVSCRDCGHNPFAVRWKEFHHGGGRYGKRVCSVANDLRRQPDHPNNRKNPFDRCTCSGCTPT